VGVFRDVLLASVERCTPLPAIADLAQRLRQGLDRLAQAHAAVQRQAADDPHATTAAAHDLLTMYGILAVGWAWLELAETALQLPEDLAATVGLSKRQLAQVWMDQQLPCLAGLVERVEHGSVALMAMDGAQV
ncbi:MAG: acyl-CoA dehydrogenase C-terminal domain-containing protein, partial [Hydrogenophaga sp.]|nr:acyl-CoA dehydrogenase C-terminal domain-containing protein [Hydrogenophaga sp.]